MGTTTMPRADLILGASSCAEVVRMASDIDTQLAAAVKRRDQARDLVRSLIEICTCEERIDVLLRRRSEQGDTDRIT